MNPILNINGFLGTTYDLGSTFVTIIQRPSDGCLAALIVDNGLEIKEYNYAKSKRQADQPNSFRPLSRGIDS